jgi:uncharacterized protein
MSRMIFINLPVSKLKTSMAFYTALGFTNNPQFSDDTAACMVLSDAIHVMLLTHDKWRMFTARPIPSTTSSEVMLCVSCESRETVDAMNHAAGSHGGTSDVNAPQDHGFMYGRSFTDPDGHIWEPMWMDMSGAPA